MSEDFDDIRSFRDHEVKTVISRLLENPGVIKLLKQLMPPDFLQHIPSLTARINNIYDFQDKFMSPIFTAHIEPTFDTLTCSGLEHLNPKESYLFISNHRDIVLDSAILNYFLHKAGFETAEIAIGDNLLKEAWIKDLVRLNKSFIVRRGLENVEMLKASRKLSSYIKETISERKQSVWIAQRAGRAKDGNDETHRGLVNMLYLCSDTSLVDHFCSLNIVPVSISYEFDPCDMRKTRELYTEAGGGFYVKGKDEDVESMKLGIILPKGKGHIHFGQVMNDVIRKLPDVGKKSTMISLICEQIDRAIQENYKLWPSNHEADELMSELSADKYNPETNRINLGKRMEAAIKEIQGANDEVRRIFLNMYQQPLLNKQKWSGQPSLIS